MPFTQDFYLTFLVAILAGAAYIAWIFRGIGRSVVLGAGLGVLAASVGVYVFMGPLNFCPFEPERNSMDHLVGIVLVAAGVGAALFLTQYVARLLLARGPDRPSLVGDHTPGAFRSRFVMPTLLLAPTIVILALFLYYPAIDLFRLSTLLTRLGTPRTAFRCVTQFSELLNPTFSELGQGLLAGALVAWGLRWWLERTHHMHNPLYGIAETLRSPLSIAALLVLTLELFNRNYSQFVLNTFFITGGTVILGLVLGLAIAYLAYQPVRGAAIYRTLLIWPYAISPAVAGVIFFVIFNQQVGILNHLLKLIGLPEPSWISDVWLAKWTIIIASVWKTLGYNILFYLAGLQNVSKELVEAAAIDGANAWQRFRSVILPSLSPITFFLIITNITFAFFETFGTIDYLTRGGPAGGTTTMIYEIYETGIVEGDLGRAAAQSIVLFVMVIGVTIYQFRTTGRRVSYGA